MLKSKVQCICFASRSFQYYVTKRTMTTISDGKKTKKDDARQNNIVWVDLEMSGLDINKEHILEMACIVTDSELNIIAEGPDLIIHQPDRVLDSMGEWCQNQHGKSGLTEAVRNSKISVTDAEAQMITFVRDHIVAGAAPLAGNSVHADRVFLQKYMPNFLNLLHYRIIDVSTIKELTRRWHPAVLADVPKKKSTHRRTFSALTMLYRDRHNYVIKQGMRPNICTKKYCEILLELLSRALDDIKESIEELRYYRKTVFK